MKLRGCANISIETWIRAAKYNERIPIRSEDINKMQSEISRGRKFPRSGMHGVAARKVPTGKDFGFFFLDTLKTVFWMTKFNL